MWIVTGCFDEEEKQSKKTKSKLLKPGQTYNIGRKARDTTHLVINKSAISRDQGTIAVGSHGPNDVTSVDAIPTITYASLARSKTHLVRNEETVQHNIAQNETVDIQSGDSLQLSSGNDKELGVTLMFQWRAVCPFFLDLPKPRMKSLVERAAPLGFKIAKRPGSHITHLVADALDASSVELYTSLMACATIVNDGWWDEVCRRAEMPRGQAESWEESFVELADIEQWSPTLPEGLPAIQLRADARRKRLFEGLTFVLLSDASPTSELMTRLELGGAKVKTIDLLSAETTSNSLLPDLSAMKRAASINLDRSSRSDKDSLNGGLCTVLAKASVQDALGRTWAKYEDMISSLGLSILTVDQIHACILAVTTDILPRATSSSGEARLLSGTSQFGGDSSSKVGQVESSLPDEVPPTLPEPRIADGGQSATQLKRRRGRTLVQDLFDDDDEVVLPYSPTTRARTPEVPSVPPKIPPSANKKRKRTVLETVFDDSIDEIPEVEPEYKRLKREEEERESSENYQKASERAAAVIDAVYRQHQGETVEMPSMTQDELQATRERRRTAQSMLEEEESKAVSRVAAVAGRKRKPEEQQDVDMDQSDIVRPAKRQAASRLHAVDGDSTSRPAAPPPREEPTPPANAKGTPNTMPSPVANRQPSVQSRKASSQKQKPLEATEVPMDTDPQFLQALASRKRGKKKEDQFDRDFNALRISAPVNGPVPVPETTDDYRAMDDLNFGGPAPVGNFMRIVLTKEVFRKDRDVSRPQPPQRLAAGLDDSGIWRGQKPWDDPKWASRPNYKAFVKNNKRPSNRHLVPVALPPVDDYGMGNTYWKGDSHSGDSTQKTRQPRSTQTNGDMPQSADQDFGGLNISGPSRGGPATKQRTDSTRRRPTNAVDDDADMDEYDVVPGSRSKPRGHRADNPATEPATSRAAGKRKIHRIDEDDEDDALVIDAPSVTRSKRSTPAVIARSGSRKHATDDEESMIAVDDRLLEGNPGGLRGTGEAASTLLSSGGKRTPVVSQQEQRKRTQALAAADDSDDDIRVRRKRKK
ncbi:hypothetical protein CALCODRAFT_557991 [Calocera cornea HHB12733]|uniref:BRCT domain-containing protein n=1 Tax=Calocera cornea HHB12733 TaxID=1353952 RepID=A0A165DDA9_9BASI|nr:hypothetical protein CALCODRAFT_557991 [Calocera cornea HHB12733]